MERSQACSSLERKKGGREDGVREAKATHTPTVTLHRDSPGAQTEASGHFPRAKAGVSLHDPIPDDSEIPQPSMGCLPLALLVNPTIPLEGV